MDDYVIKPEYEEFKKRMQEENHRQNRRIDLLEQTSQQINDLTVSVGKLASGIESMVKEQERQGERLGALEGRDGEMWRKVVGHVATTVAGILIGYMFTQIGIV